MKQLEVSCPKCSHSFTVDESIQKQIKEKVSQELDNQKKNFKNQIIEEVEKKKEIEIIELKEQLRETSESKNSSISELIDLKKELRAAKRKEEEIKLEIEKKVETKLEQEKNLFQKKIKDDFSKKNELVIKELQDQVEESDKSYQVSLKEMLLLKKQLRESKSKEKNIDLEIESKVNDQLQQHKEQFLRDYQEKHRFDLLQKEKVIEQMRSKTEELQLKLTQGSQQLQGEVVEEDFEELLHQKFPVDQIEPVPKGVNGADIIHYVKDNNLRDCGSIIWEFKNTKNFSSQWIPKLREDQRKIGSELAILASNVLPKNSPDIDHVDGVYLVRFDLAIPLCVALRNGLIELNRSKLKYKNKDDKMSIMYDYLTGNSFAQKFRSILNAYQIQKNQIIKEKKALMSSWAKREKQLDIIIESSTSLFGDIEGIIGPGVAIIPELQLDFEEENENKLQ